MDTTTLASDTVAAPLTTNTAPRPTTRQQHRAAQRKYHEEKRRGCGRRVRIAPETFLILRKYGNSRKKECTDQRKSAATDGLVALLHHPEIHQWIGVSLLHPTQKAVVEHSTRPDDRELIDRMRLHSENQIRQICIHNNNPLKSVTLKQLIECFVGMRVTQVAATKTKELWLPNDALPMLKVIASKVHEGGAQHFVSTCHRPSIGRIIDWLVDCPAIAAELLGSAAEAAGRE
jgi:hypothetical protein